MFYFLSIFLKNNAKTAHLYTQYKVKIRTLVQLFLALIIHVLIEYPNVVLVAQLATIPIVLHIRCNTMCLALGTHFLKTPSVVVCHLMYLFVFECSYASGHPICSMLLIGVFNVRRLLLNRQVLECCGRYSCCFIPQYMLAEELFCCQCCGRHFVADFL